ncbi:retrovirus-related pol polyprotein from transposon TNT 1-94 [Tanacetum coccineum]
MAQQQHATDVHPDELCPPNKRYDLMDANKKIDFEQVQCPPESKLLTNIIKNRPLRFSIAASSSVPWIYMAQFWHTLKEDGSKYRLMFMLDKKELSLTLDDFRTIFHLPQATDNNHDSFVPPPSFLDMVPFYKNELGFTMELKTSSSFKTTGLLQPWQTLCKIFSKCLTTRVTGWDQPPLQIMQMMYCFINNIHVDYAELLWEGLHYSLHHPTSSIPYPRFTKIIISHYMTNFPEISRRVRDRYHNLKDDDIMKNIFNSGRHKDRVGMKIPDWMISEEMKHTEHYRMYAEVFGIDVPLTRPQPTESTQGTHRTPSAPRRSTRLTPPAPVPTVDKADEMILQDTLQVSLAEHKSREEQEARENVELVNEHLASVEIEKMVEGPENVIDDSSIPRNDDQNIPGTRLEPRSDKESPEVEITNDEEVEITNVVIPVNVNEEEEEITDEVYELKRREKGKIVEESRSTPFPTPIRSPRIHIDLVSSDTEKLQELTGRYGYLFEHLRAKFLSRKSFDTLVDHLQEVMVESLPTMVDKHIKEQVKKQVPEQHGKLQVKISSQLQNAIDTNIPSLVDASVRSYMSRHILHVHPAQPQTTSVPEQQYQLYLSMKADPQLQQQDIAIWLALQMKFETLQVPQTTCRTLAVRLRDQDDPHDDAHPEGENSVKQKKTSEYEAHVTGESSEQVNEKEQGQSSSRNQEQTDDYDFWTESYASDDDEILTKQVSQDIMEEVSLTINEAELKKIADEMLRQRCTSGDEHQYHIDQMKNFLKSDIIVLSLHKFPAIIFNDVDIKERTFIWVNKCIKKFNPYARYGVKHWKNPHAKIFYIKRQKEPRKPKEVVYSNLKIIQVIKMYWELGHEHKFITKIVARRANECIVSITEPDYKNLNKNDFKDMYLLIMNGKVPDYAETCLMWSLSVFIRSSLIWERVYDFQLGIESYQQKVNLTAPTISFLGIEKHKIKERIKPLRVRALVMTIGLDLPKQILEAQTETIKPENLEAEDVGEVGCHALIEVTVLEVISKGFRYSAGYEYCLPSADRWTKQKNHSDTRKYMLRACVIDFGNGWDRHLPLIEFSYNNSYHMSIKAAPFEALYGHKCHSPICWAEFRDTQLSSPEIIHETTEKIVSPWKGVIRFGKWRKLNPRYIGPFKVLAKVGTIAYKLELPQQLSRVHNTFHVSNLKKSLSDEPLAILLDEIHIDNKLHFVEEPVKIMDSEVKRLNQSRIPIIKVRWNSRRGPEFTWEREDQFRKKLEEEKARKRGKVFNWETAKYSKIWYDEDVLDLISVETEFPAIVFNDSLTSNETPSCKPMVSSLNDEIDFRISFDESDDEDYTVKMDYPNITMEEYIRLEEEKARRHGKVYNWETTTYVDDEVFPAEEQPMPATDSPTHHSPGHSDDADDAEEEGALSSSDHYTAVCYSADQDPYLAYRVTARMSIRAPKKAPAFRSSLKGEIPSPPLPISSPPQPMALHKFERSISRAAGLTREMQLPSPIHETEILRIIRSRMPDLQRVRLWYYRITWDGLGRSHPGDCTRATPIGGKKANPIYALTLPERKERARLSRPLGHGPDGCLRQDPLRDPAEQSYQRRPVAVLRLVLRQWQATKEEGPAKVKPKYNSLPVIDTHTATTSPVPNFSHERLWVGTEGVVDLTQWFERMETVFRISNCTVENQPKTMQEAIEMATELMDRRNNTFAERQAKNKRKFEDTPRNNQNQQPNKRQNTGRAYAAGNGDKKSYEGTKPLCSKCHFRKDCPQWKNKNQGNGNGVARAYAVGVAGQNPNNNV